LALFLAAFIIEGFFAGTTDETTTFRTFRFLKNPATKALVSWPVPIRTGAEIRLFDANAIFAYELLISINK
jgi:hypothetical protein